MKTVAIIQARMGSTRLHGKVLAEAAGKPLLVHQLERLERCETLDEIVVAMPRTRESQPIAQAVANLILDSEDDNFKVGWTSGDELDVLGRVLGAARTTGAGLIVELTADCPLIDPVIVDQTVSAFLEDTTLDFCANTIEVREALGLQDQPTYARGMDVRVFPTEQLAYVAQKTRDPVDREHVSIYFWEHLDEFAVKWVPAPQHLASDDRLTVDTVKDLVVARGIFGALYPADPAFGLGDILAFLATQPDLRQLNRDIQQKNPR